VVAAGLDWNSELPFYAQRRALLIPGWIGYDFANPRVQSAAANLAPMRAGALVICNDARRRNAFILEALQRWSMPPQPAVQGGGCAVFLREGS
jgi:hypothetical protein